MEGWILRQIAGSVNTDLSLSRPSGRHRILLAYIPSERAKAYGQGEGGSERIATYHEDRVFESAISIQRFPIPSRQEMPGLKLEEAIIMQLAAHPRRFRITYVVQKSR